MRQPVMQAETDLIYQTYGKDLYRITGEEGTDSIMNMLQGQQPGDASPTGGGGLTIAADSIDSGASASTTVQATGSATRQGKSTFDNTTPGYILGFDPKDGYAKFYIGNSTNYLDWDGTTLTISGSLIAGSLNIPDTVTANSFHVDSQGNAWWGATTLGAATASVLKTGVATFTQVVTIGSATGDNVSFNGSNVTVTALTYSQNFTAAETIAAGVPVAIGPYQSDGGVAFDAKSAARHQRLAHTTTETFSFTVANNTNRMMIVFVTTANGETITATYGGVALTSAFTAINFSGSSIIYGFYLIAPAVGTANVVFSGLADSGGQLYIDYGIYSYYNVVQSAPTAATQNTASASSVSKSVTPAGNGYLVITGVATDQATGSLTGSNNVNNSANDIGSAGNYTGYFFGDSYKLANAVPITISVTGAGTPSWGLGAISLAPITSPSFYAYKASSDNGTNYGWNSNWKANAYIGFSTSSSTLGNPIGVSPSAMISGLSGLQPSGQYYLNDTAGTIGTSVGTNTRKVGIAISTTQLVATNIW